MMGHIERLRELQRLALPEGLERRVHQNRLLRMAREGGQMTTQNLSKIESRRKNATLVALAIEGTATVTDQIIDLPDRIIGKLLNAARHKHQQRFPQSGWKINDPLLLYGKISRALVNDDLLLCARYPGGAPAAGRSRRESGNAGCGANSCVQRRFAQGPACGGHHGFYQKTLGQAGAHGSGPGPTELRDICVLCEL
jgi:hypothetical protein